MADAAEQQVPDVRAIMAEIRQSIRSKVEGSRDEWPVLRPERVEAERSGHSRAGEIQHSEELRMVNLLAGAGLTADATGITSHRRGIAGRVIVAAKRRLQRFIWSLFQANIEAEREFRSHVTRVLNQTSFYIDDRDGAIFWEVVRKIDTDVARMLRRVEELIDEQRAMVVGAERRLDERIHDQVLADLEALKGLSSEVRTLDSVVRGLEGIVARVGHQEQPAKVGEALLPDVSYLLLENRFRGSPAMIAERVKPYVDEFRRHGKFNLPVLDIGAGRGEMVAALAKSGLPAYGVDLDRGMVDEARASGADVRLGDGLAHLASLEDGALGGVIATQVVEHLSREQLQQLFFLAARKVATGGTVIFETINPCSLVALSSNYFRDLTHVWPLHPDTLAFEMQLAGLKMREVRYLSPVPPAAQLQEVSVVPSMSPALQQAFGHVNAAFRQLNALLYGYQDYCIIAEPADR